MIPSLTTENFFYTFFFVGITVLFYAIHRRGHRSRLPLPPGPKKLPIIGNLLDVPAELSWEAYDRWSKEFGVFSSRSDGPPRNSSSDSDIIHVNVAGTSIVVLSSMQVISDLFDRRSSLYSDR
jgi:hypothetical protein